MCLQLVSGFCGRLNWWDMEVLTAQVRPETETPNSGHQLRWPPANSGVPYLRPGPRPGTMSSITTALIAAQLRSRWPQNGRIHLGFLVAAQFAKRINYGCQIDILPLCQARHGPQPQPLWRIPTAAVS